MDFTPPQKRAQPESIVPMINVVFLLLIFFLMTSEIAPPAPAEITNPVSQSEAAEPVAEPKLYVDKAGEIYFEDLTGEAALTALQGLSAEAPKVLLSADEGVEASKLAALLSKLAAAGLSDVELVVARP